MAITTALNLAKYVIKECISHERPVSNLQLQKILYYIQVSFLKSFNEPCFGEDIEAWKFGPVVPVVYYKYCGFGATAINIASGEVNDIPPKYKKTIDEVIKSKEKIFPWTLVSDTHTPGGAWSRAYKAGGSFSIISTHAMKNYG